VRRFPALATVVLLALSIAVEGCGEGGVAAGATVSVYVAAPLCNEARSELKRHGAAAGEVDVRVACLPPVETGGGRDLARSGANARRATEDSSSVAYLETPGPAAKFGRTIVESADLAWIETNSGARSLREVLEALEESGSSSPRNAVRKAQLD
jgi:hypothetical protein